MSAQELRKDPVVGRWVIFSPSRIHRPHDYYLASAADSRNACRFCSEQNESEQSAVVRIPAERDSAWRKLVVNSPASVVTGSEELFRRGEGMFDLVAGFGAHEIVITSPDHHGHFSRLSTQEIEELILLWRDRIIALKADEKLRAVTICGNHGAAAGAKLTHAHNQIIATPIIPRILADEISQSYTYFQSKERCVYCDIHESDPDRSRGVFENQKFVVLTPFASRFSFEMWVMPIVHSSHFEDISGPDISALADALKSAFGALEKTLDNPPYSFVLHNAPTHEKGMAYFHWHLEIMPRMSNVAGFEWGTGFHINPTFPEEAARRLRESNDHN